MNDKTLLVQIRVLEIKVESLAIVIEELMKEVPLEVRTALYAKMKAYADEAWGIT